MKKAIKTFAKIGDVILDEVEVGAADSPIPHGNIDLMVTSCFRPEPPVCFFMVKQHTPLYHYTSASMKTVSTFNMDSSGKLILYHAPSHVILSSLFL